MQPNKVIRFPHSQALKTSRNALDSFEGDQDTTALVVETLKRLRTIGFGINDKLVENNYVSFVKSKVTHFPLSHIVQYRSLMLDLWTICNRFTYHIGQIKKVEGMSHLIESTLILERP